MLVVAVGARWTDVLEALRALAAPHVVLHREATPPSDAVIERLVSAAERGTLIATVSPIPLAVGGGHPTIHPALDLPAATLAEPDARLLLISRDALESVLPFFDATGDWSSALSRWSAHAVRSGWRHVAAPGLSLRREDHGLGHLGEPVGRRRRVRPRRNVTTSDPSAPDWLAEYIANTEGPANQYLEAHRLRCEIDLRPIRLAVDGSCLLGEPTTGTHHVVLQSARELARARPGAAVTLVAPTAAHAFATTFLTGIDNAQVQSKDEVTDYFDVVYRPYQIYTPGELRWCREAGHRMVLSQLDMIAFTNPWYYPRLDLFLTIRNLIRAALRMADGIAYISAFGRRSVEEQVAGLEDRRSAVVYCGTDHIHAEPPVIPPGLPADLDRFVFCLSATFWHKNRPLVYAAFRTMRERGYRGRLVVAGPEPFYGRSHDADDAEIAGMPPDVQADIIHLAHVSEREKWWLLSHAESVVYPSIVEGFGLVPFEAMTAGTPTLFRRGTALAEVMYESVTMADTWRADDWADILLAWSADPALAGRQVEAIRRVGSRRTWAGSAASTWALIDAVVSLPRRDAMPGGSEGGPLSTFPRVQLRPSPSQRAATFTRRVRSYLRRRLGR